MATSSSAITDRPLVYFVHGLLGTAYGHFGHQINAWRNHYCVVPVDLPGHGSCRLAAEPDYLNQAAAYLAAVMDRFGPGNVVAASYLGAPVSVRCAEARPDLVTSLVLTGFAPGIPKEVFIGLLAGFHRLAAEQSELAAEYDRLHTGRWRQTLDAFTDHVERAYEQTVLVLPEKLDALGIQTLVVNGSLKSIERAAAEGAASFGPMVSGLVIEGAGHIASHDAPEEFTKAVDAFWRDRTRAS